MSLLCPAHWGHRLRLWFSNPPDGLGPIERSQLDAEELPQLFEVVTEHELDALTLSAGGGTRPLQLAQHWHGWIVEGRYWTAY